jgi:hypothetical protein
MPRKWSLKPLPVPEVSSFRLLAPIIATIATIVIPTFIQGVTRHMKPLLLGLFLCSVWVAVSLWPLATICATRLLNRSFGFTRRRQSTTFGAAILAQRELIRARRKAFGGMHSIIFVSLCLIVLCGFRLASGHFIEEHIEQGLLDADKDLFATYSMPSERVLKNAQFTITNSGVQDIFVRTLDCNVIFAAFDSSDGPRAAYKDVNFGMATDIMLHAGGDHESANCPTENRYLVIRNGIDRVACADVAITVAYSIADIPDRTIRKRFRYALYRGNRDWTPIALDDPPVPCDVA